MDINFYILIDTEINNYHRSYLNKKLKINIEIQVKLKNDSINVNIVTQVECYRNILFYRLLKYHFESIISLFKERYRLLIVLLSYKFFLYSFFY